MKITIVFLFLIMSLFNFFDIKYSSGNVNHAHDVAKVLSATNQLHSETQNLASFIIDVNAFSK